jgi:hypothetical protein
MFEVEFAKFHEEQCRTASGQRLEQLRKDLTGEKKLIGTVVWPVLKSFDGLTMEYELVTISGVRIFIDVFYQPLWLALESEGFTAHAGNITRDRFSFERMRARTLAMYGYRYVPFSWDELDKKPESCRRSLYELLGRFSSPAGMAYEELTVYEREVLRYALRLCRPLRLADVCYCLQTGPEASRKVLRKLVGKKILKPLGAGTMRLHEFILEEKATDYLL